MNANACWELLGGPCGRTIILALVHTLWQATAMAAVVWLVLRAIPARRSGLRYGIGAAALGAVAVVGLGTWAVLNFNTQPAGPQQPSVAQPTAAVDNAARLDPAVAKPASAPENAGPTVPPDGNITAMPTATTATTTVPTTTPTTPPEDAVADVQESNAAGWTAVLVAAWLAGVVLMTLRTIYLVAGARRITRAAQTPADERLLAIVERWRARLGIVRRIRVLLSRELASPAVLGLLRPTLILPASLASGIPPEHLDAILLHELAHIRRYDYLVNLGQLAIEAILFFNPAVWWLSRQMRIEREACCDATAVRITGSPLRYAEVLADSLERLRGIAPESIVAAAFVSRPNRPVLDRVQRVLSPSHRPQLRLSWASLAGVLFVGLVLLAGLQRGAQLAVAAAAEILTPAQRIETMEQTQKAIAEQQSAQQQSAQQEQRKPCTISGVIRTADGKKPNAMTSLYRNGIYRGFASDKVDDEDTFRFNVPHGEYTLRFDSPRYAVASLGPFKAPPGGRIENLEVVLQPGFSARIQLLGPDGLPLRGVDIRGNVQVGRRESMDTCWKTDSEGIATIQNAVSRPYDFFIRTAGFRPARKTAVRLDPKNPLIWMLLKSAPTTGIVLAPDGTPVADAAVQLAREVKRGPIYEEENPNFLHHGPPIPLTTTNAEGRFTVDTLQDDVVSILLVESAKQDRAWVKAAPGNALEIRLQKPLTVAGTITGDLSLLEKQGPQSILYFQHSAEEEEEEEEEGSIKSVPVRIENGKGRFEIRDLCPGTLYLTAGPAEVVQQIRESITDLVIPLSKDGTTVGQRRVILQMDVPPGLPAPRGNMQMIAGVGRFQCPPWKDGKAEMQAFVGSYLSYQTIGTIGYWFPMGSLERVPPGDEPLVLHVPAIEAGAISGTLVDAAGRPRPETAHFSAIAVEPSSRLKGKHDVSLPAYNTIHSRFLVTPLPLDGTYVATVQTETDQVAVSPPLRLDADRPFHQIELQLPEGVDAPVRVLGPDGKPVSDVRVILGLKWRTGKNTTHSVSDLLSHQMTDAEGRVRFKHLNFDAGEYELTVSPRRKYPAYQATPARDGRETVIRLRKGCVVEGRVLDTAGRPVSEVTLSAHPKVRQPNDAECHAEAPTDAQGRFRFSNLDEREYTLIVHVLQPVLSSTSLQYFERPKTSLPEPRPTVVGGSGKPIEIRIASPTP